MEKYKHRLVTIFIIVIIAALACNLPTAVTPGESDTGTGDTSGNGDDAGDAQAMGSPTVTFTIPPDATFTPTLSHSVLPSGPASVSSFMTDRSTKNLAAEKRANADEFNILLFERPFTSESMDYQAYIDIIRAELSTSPPWVYITIFLEGAPPDGEVVRYGVEFDTDVDGRGDWLVMGLAPPSSDWTTAGVYVYKDSNNDVGASNPIEADGGVKNLNGHDEMVFDQGYNTSDPDGAWIRRDPTNSSRIQLAVKSAMVGLDDAYMWGAWVDGGPMEAAYFDYNDYFTISEAGSPVSNSSNYPLNLLALVDNTCRWTVGFEPVGDEPGLCYIPPTPTSTPLPTHTPTVALGSISGYVYDDWQPPLDTRTAGEPGIGGATIRLGRGSCPSTGEGTRTSGADGGFIFTGLTAGTYCITVQLPSGCGEWLPTGATSRTVTIAAGEAGSAGNFGFGVYVCMFE